ncbi:DUF655 domain-containing protein [Lautropia mirabilis]
MQTIFRAGAALLPPTSRLARLVVVLRTFLSPFLLFPWLLAGAAPAWAADLSLQGASAPVVAAATVPDTAQTDIPGHVDVLAQGSPPDLVGLPDASLAANAAIDANRATAEQLQTLRGIGPAMAARIIAERERQPFASLDDLARRVRGVGTRRLRQWQEAGLVLSSRQSAVVQDRAVHGHRGHAPSVGARGADTQGTEVRGAGVHSPHAMGANALGVNVQGAHAPGTQAPVGGKSARAGRVSTHQPRHAGAAGRTIEVIRGNPRQPSRGTTARPVRATKGRSAAGRSSAERPAAGRAAAERSPAGPQPGDAAQALSRSASTTGSRTASRARGHRADEPSCRLQRRVHQRGRSGKGAQVRRSTAPSLFEDRPLFDCRSIFDERSRLLPRS